MVMKAKWILAMFGAMTGVALAAPKLPEVEGDEYRELVEEIKPAGDELKWLEIEWGTDLWAVRQRAAEVGKPIFLWEMDGHPLACT